MHPNHKYKFLVLRILLWLAGIRKNRKVYYWSNNKRKVIPGRISSVSGESINETQFHEVITVKFDEPTMGRDPRYYKQGTYDYDQFKSLFHFREKNVCPTT